MQQPHNISKDVYVIDGARTPFLKTQGIAGPFSAVDLSLSVAKPLLLKHHLTANVFDEVILGCVSPGPDEANIARIVALRLGCAQHVPAWTVQRNCASGLQAIGSAVSNIASGKSQLVLAGGCEAMSRAPWLLKSQMTDWLVHLKQTKNLKEKIKTLSAFRPAFLVPIIGLLKALTDPVVNLSMGQTAEELCYRFGLSKEAIDQYAVNSHERVLQAQMQGIFSEIQPLFSVEGSVYEQDNGVRADTTLEKLSRLKPVFDKFGNITAGNSSQVTDGAAMLILGSEEAVEKYQLPVLSKVKDIKWAALDPKVMGLGPIHAMTPLLKSNQLSLEDIEHIEINEAFAAQVLACKKAWEDTEYCKTFLGLDSKMGSLDMEKLNPHGGAIAIGHPVGASGARLVLHCAKMMEKNQNRFAMASLCIGGGQGGAILLERV